MSPLDIAFYLISSTCLISLIARFINGLFEEILKERIRFLRNSFE